MSAMEAKLLRDFADSVTRRYTLLTQKGEPCSADTFGAALVAELEYRTDNEEERDREYARQAAEHRRRSL